MILVRSPLRISLGGGGTDLPSYYARHGGFFVTGAIDKYVYLSVHRRFVDELFLKYSELERAASRDEIKHPIFRAALQLLDVRAKNLELTSTADIPAGTGLGSSGAFTTALLRALHQLQRRTVAPAALAEEACHIEIGLLREPIGKQDQYAAAFGGLTTFTVAPDGQVSVAPLRIGEDARAELEDHLRLYFTGYTRAAGTVLDEQRRRTEADDPAMLDNLHFVKDLGYRSRDALEAGDLEGFAELMHRLWLRKRERGTSTPQIDAWYELGRANGALGGKLIGAGGGGFLMFYSTNHAHLRRAMQGAGLQEVRVRFDHEGTKVLHT